MKLIIAGGRDYIGTELDMKALDKLHESYGVTKVVSGGAKGADYLGEHWAQSKGLPIRMFPAEWDNLDAVPCHIKVRPDGSRYNGLAGPNRNRKMAEYADALAFFPGGTGTKDMIRVAQNFGLKIFEREEKE